MPCKNLPLFKTLLSVRFPPPLKFNGAPLPSLQVPAVYKSIYSSHHSWTCCLLCAEPAKPVRQEAGLCQKEPAPDQVATTPTHPTTLTHYT